MSYWISPCTLSPSVWIQCGSAIISSRGATAVATRRFQWHGSGRSGPDLPIERAASRWIVSDDAAEIVEKIRAYVQLGFNHLVFHAPGPDQKRFLALFGDRLEPLLRKTFG